MPELSDLAEAIVRRACRISDFEMRVALMREEILETDAGVGVELMAVICLKAEARTEPYPEALLALCTAISQADEALRWALSELARIRGHDAVDRIVRARPVSFRSADSIDERVPDYGSGRPLTLGERKAIARRPRRDLIERALSDPHPEVIRQLLRNSRITEADVLRICSRRPCSPEVLRSIARSNRWAQRPRIRIALVRNPFTPTEIALQLASLLMRQELRDVVLATELDPVLRAACADMLRCRVGGSVLGGEDEDPTLH